MNIARFFRVQKAPICWRYLEHEFGVIQYKKIDLILKKLKKASYNTW
jgi:hypothetical protein